MPFCTANDINIHYTIHGTGEYVLLLHGLGSCAEDWDCQIEALSTRYCVIAVDLRGHGKTTKPEGAYSIPLYAQDMEKFLKNLNIDAIHLIGFSLGGMTALQMAVDAPRLVKSLTVINAPASMPVKSWFPKLPVIIRYWTIKILGMKALGKMIARKLFPLESQKHLYKKFVHRMQCNSKTSYLKALNSLSGWSVENHLSTLPMPVLIATADEDYTPVAYKQALSQKIPNARLAIIRDSRHATPMDQPHILNTLILDFFNSSSKNGARTSEAGQMLIDGTVTI